LSAENGDVRIKKGSAAFPAAPPAPQIPMLNVPPYPKTPELSKAPHLKTPKVAPSQPVTQ
jgi:hypothetical protein